MVLLLLLSPAVLNARAESGIDQWSCDPTTRRNKTAKRAGHGDEEIIIKKLFWSHWAAHTSRCFNVPAYTAHKFHCRVFLSCSISISRVLFVYRWPKVAKVDDEEYDRRLVTISKTCATNDPPPIELWRSFHWSRLLLLAPRVRPSRSLLYTTVIDSLNLNY